MTCRTSGVLDDAMADETEAAWHYEI